MAIEADGTPHANRLAGETSPYLRQHAHNPVDWYPWGPEALERARQLDRPIFLSIGYAACHWCHVMERESFEDAATATVLNEGFVAIKVDREERPDLDQLYMGAVQAMTGHGGWPMSVFLAPDGRPFHAGTYFPDTPRSGMPSFRQVLAGVRRAWDEQRSEVEATGAHVIEALLAGRSSSAAGAASAAGGGPAAAPVPDLSVLEQAVATLEQSFDPRQGGWTGAPKFPAPMTIEFLLRRHVASGDPRPLAMALRTLDTMAAGGIHDQLGGGFHRYSTDAVWHVPHFEQMLYDNAQLARTYAHAWALTGDPSCLATFAGTLDFIVRELATAGGGFAASLDADTDGVEGATFTWTADEIREVLGADAPLFEAAYGVTERGTWEGRTILSRVLDVRRVAEQCGIQSPEAEARLGSARSALLARRSRRPQPARDDKVLAAWNGLAIAALADASRLLAASGDPELAGRSGAYRAAAEAAASDVLAGLGQPEGRLRRSWKDGRATADGVLEDYADLAEGLLALYEATFDERWFAAAVELVETILVRFADADGGFFDTPDDGEALIVRPRDEQDNATPSGGAMATTVLLRLAALTGEGRYRTAAEAALARVGLFLGRYPGAFAQWLCALEFALGPVVEVAVVGDPATPEARRLLDVVVRGYRPFRVLAAAAEPDASAVPLLRGRFAMLGRPTAFVCRHFACRQPVTEPEALEALLAGS